MDLVGLGQEDLVQVNIIKFCAEECHRQSSGELSVYHMIDAWGYASIEKGFNESTITVEFIRKLGQLVEPEDNAHGFRTTRIGVTDGFSWTEIGSNWENIPRDLDRLLESYYDGSLEPSHAKAVTKEDQFYLYYEGIHPFVDGNGRTGKILYNYLSGTLSEPKMPPNFFGIGNP